LYTVETVDEIGRYFPGEVSLEQKEALLAVKGAMALNSPFVGIGDIEDDVSLESIGIASKTKLTRFTSDLHRIVRSEHEFPVYYDTFAARLQITGASTAAEIADLMVPLIVVLPVCSTVDPVPDKDSCRLWMKDAFFCRIRLAVTQWANPKAIPPGGVTEDLTLESLVELFDDAALGNLVKATNNQNVFRPFNVTVKHFPGVAGTTTVDGYAKILWEKNPTHCSELVKYV
jgi:hypothetical protein